jgi:hypothetical protein
MERNLLGLMKLSDPDAPSFPHWNTVPIGADHR